MNSSDAPSAARLRSLRVVWICFINAVIVYFVVLRFVLQTPDSTPATDTDLFRSVLAVAAVLSAAVSIWWRRRANGETKFGPPIDTPGESPGNALQRNCIIAWAFSESVAIFGLVLGLVARDAQAYLPFGLGALVLLYLHRPAAWRQRPLPQNTT